ncbi:hypothetical protein CHS0354_023809 [Potamilus streckersoni]|uniref:Acyl carrier protein n=1 Tax=Potamilus streckersoni TaxID=2493646 RepID=A0AAE0VML4_9BIVA|nr:hypothetical protein CHS0354_023809 [Potamilus streckersoni]
MKISLAGRVALITGGSRGIGKTITENLGLAGAKVAFTYKSSSVDEVISDFNVKGIESMAVWADAVDFVQAQSCVDSVVNKFGSLDILVCNAGITQDNLLMRMDETQWDSVINSNLKSAFNYVKSSIRRMLGQKYGKIVFIGSVVGLSGNAGQSNYAASKAGLIGFAKSVAKELGSRNIMVNVVVPGWIETDMTRGLAENQRKAFLENVPLRRAGSTQDVANLVTFLVNIISSKMGIGKEEIKEESKFTDDLGADSLDTVELVMEFEQKFDIRIPDADAEKITTVKNAIDYIKEKKG